LATALYLYELEPTELNLQRTDQITTANPPPIRVIDGIDQKLPRCVLLVSSLTETWLLPLRQVQFDLLGGKPHQFVIALEGKQCALNLIP
jgi:hypothetical protein